MLNSDDKRMEIFVSSCHVRPFEIRGMKFRWSCIKLWSGQEVPMLRLALQCRTLPVEPTKVYPENSLHSWIEYWVTLWFLLSL
jgi:hypothetical protein